MQVYYKYSAVLLQYSTWKSNEEVKELDQQSTVT